MGDRPQTVAALLANHHHHRFGVILLGLLVIGGIVAGFVYWNNRRNAHQASGPDHWDNRPGTAVPTAAAPPAPAPTPSSATAPPAPAPTPSSATANAPTVPPATEPLVRPIAPTTPRPQIPLSLDGDYAVETRGLTKRFGDNVAVDAVDLVVPRGCAFGYLGPNGAGKTTLIRTLLGLTHADSGSMALLGIPVPAERNRALARVGAIVDEPRFYGHLTGRQNLLMLAAARSPESGERIAPALARVGLTGRADHKVAQYSMGMRQRLGVAACLLDDPELLILDEPMNGLDPAGMHEMRTMIKELVAEGRTVMLSSHLLDEVERTCDAVAIVDRGRVIRQGAIDELVHGSETIVRVGCSAPAEAARLLSTNGATPTVSVDESGLTVTLPIGATQESIAAIVRQLVTGDISVYRVEEVRTSLEDWFLSVTSRLGEAP